MAIELRPPTKSNEQIIRERRENKLDLLLEMKNEKQNMNKVKNIPPQPPKDRLIKEGGFVVPPPNHPNYDKIMEKHNNKKWWEIWKD